MDLTHEASCLPDLAFHAGDIRHRGNLEHYQRSPPEQQRKERKDIRAAVFEEEDFAPVACPSGGIEIDDIGKEVPEKIVQTFRIRTDIHGPYNYLRVAKKLEVIGRGGAKGDVPFVVEYFESPFREYPVIDAKSSRKVSYAAPTSDRDRAEGDRSLVTCCS